MSVVVGPWSGEPITQSIGEGTGSWFVRMDDGRLAVAVPYGGVHIAPVPPAKPTAPIPNRPPHPSRITLALNSRGLEGPEVDEALGVQTDDDHVVDMWERGTLCPTQIEVRRLAQLTGYPLQFFYQGPVPEMTNVFICPAGVWWGDTHE